MAPAVQCSTPSVRKKQWKQKCQQKVKGSSQSEHRPLLPAEAYRKQILDHISSHRVTFLQGNTGCGKSSAVPQFILDDAIQRGQGGKVMIIVTQPRRIAAVSLAEHVAKLRGQRVGLDVGYSIGQDSASTPFTRLMYVTTGYILQVLGHRPPQKALKGITHLILDEVHERSTEQDLLLLMAKLQARGGMEVSTGDSRHSVRSVLQPTETKLIIMSATMDGGPLADYFRCVHQLGAPELVPIFVGGSRFPVEIVHIDGLRNHLPSMPKELDGLVTRLVRNSGSDDRALDGTVFPRYVMDLITGLVRHMGRADDVILIFLASLADICQLHDRFENLEPPKPGSDTFKMEVFFVHSCLSKEELRSAVAEPSPGTLKVVLATNIAESSLTIPKVRVVIDLGHRIHTCYDEKHPYLSMSRVWCSKASAIQRAGRVGRLLPGKVFRLFTSETYQHLSDHDKPIMSGEHLNCCILQMKSAFSYYTSFPFDQLLMKLLDPPTPENLEESMRLLESSGVIKFSSVSSWELTRLGRLSTHFLGNIDIAKLILFGLTIGCGADCVVLAAGLRSTRSLFYEPIILQGSSNPPKLQELMIKNMRARMQLDGGFCSDLIVFRQVYQGWIRMGHSGMSGSRWLAQSDLRNSSLMELLVTVKSFANRTIQFLDNDFNHPSMRREKQKLSILASIDVNSLRPSVRVESIFCDSIALVQIAIAGAFAGNVVVGTLRQNLEAVAETNELQIAGMLPNQSLKLTGVSPSCMGADMPKLERALKMIGPLLRIVPLRGGSVLVEYQRDGLFHHPQSVISDLCSSVRVANRVGVGFDNRSTLGICSKDSSLPEAKEEKVSLGRPSSGRHIAWNTKVGEKLVRVTFERFSILNKSVETNDSVPFHIAVAASLVHSFGSMKSCRALLATVLSPDYLFSVLVLIMCRPLTAAEIHIRVHTKSDRIYHLKVGSTVLDLIPKFIPMKTLAYVENLRERLRRFMEDADIHDDNLELGMRQLHRFVIDTGKQIPVLAPEIGPWLTYPSLRKVRKVNPEPNAFTSKKLEGQRKTPRAQNLKGRTSPESSSCGSISRLKSGLNASSKEKVHIPPKRSTPPSIPLKSSTETRETNQPTEISTPGPTSVPKFFPVLILSSSYTETSSAWAYLQESTVKTTCMEQAFMALDPQVNQTHLRQWMEGDNSLNGEFFNVLQRFAEKYGNYDNTKVVLAYVYNRRLELVNKKQRSQIGAWYHSLCNPERANHGSSTTLGTEPGQSMEVHTHSSKPNLASMSSNQPAETNIICKQIAVGELELKYLEYRLPKYKSSAKIHLPSVHFWGAETKCYVTICGKPSDVELDSQWIATVTQKCAAPPTFWVLDLTYIESNYWGQKVSFVELNKGTGGDLSVKQNLRSRNVLRFLIQGENTCTEVGDCSSRQEDTSLHSTEMLEVFDNAMKRVRRSEKIELQARLGRIVFTCPSNRESDFPFKDGQSQPLGRLRPAFEQNILTKHRFDDTVPKKDFFYLRACLQLCYPKAVWRHRTYMITVSRVNTVQKRNIEEKLTFEDDPENHGKFCLQKMEIKRKLVAANILRLKESAIVADLRLSLQMMETCEATEDAQEFVAMIVRKGTQLVFPDKTYKVLCERHKDAEFFQFEQLKVKLSQVIEVNGNVSRSKYEVEFEADGGTGRQLVADFQSRIPAMLEQVQSICSNLCFMGPCTSSTTLAQTLLRSWKVQHEEAKLKDILAANILPSLEVKLEEDQEEISMQLCNLVEKLYHHDTRLLKDSMDIVLVELQLLVLQTICSMNLKLTKSMESRVKKFLTTNPLQAQNALQYACLLKCHCSPLDKSWSNILHPYLGALILEDRSSVLQPFFSHLNFLPIHVDRSGNQLLETFWRSSPLSILSALSQLIQNENASRFLSLLVLCFRYGAAVSPYSEGLVKHFVQDSLCYHDSKAVAFVSKCLEWIVENLSVTSHMEAQMQILFWLLDSVQSLNLFVSEACRTEVTKLLLKLPTYMERKRHLEQVLCEVYGVHETIFRNLHYQNILLKLKSLKNAHKDELLRRGLSQEDLSKFNFQSWSGGTAVHSSALIPGVSRDGTHLVGSPGIFIPARDPSGQILGGQIKVDVVKAGKYLWVSSNNQFDGGKGPKINGELPLFCCIPGKIDSVVGLCEGGLKAHVLAALSGLPTIGASGADFMFSKCLLQSYLARMAVQQIIFFPDAGSQCNDQVAKNYFHTFRLLREWDYHVVVAWWGQVNKEEHDDIDDYLSKHDCVPDLPLLSTRQFWKLLQVDVKDKLKNEFPDYSEPQTNPSPQIPDEEEEFEDADRIKIVKKPEGDCFVVTIPKEIIKKMPMPPNDLVTPQSVQTFSIEVRMVQMHDVASVEAALLWLLPENETSGVLGLDCEHGHDGELVLIQLSMHQRCILIREISELPSHSPRLAELLSSKTILKVGAEVQMDALAIYAKRKLLVNGCKNISHAYKTKSKTMGMMQIFRILFQWEWLKKKEVTKSDWACTRLSLEQVKYAALDAWTSRMIALQGAAIEAGIIPVTSLEDLPIPVLDLFGRAISDANRLRCNEKTDIETIGDVITTASGKTLRLLQHSFRSRVLGRGAKVELQFNNGQSPTIFNAQSKAGRSVLLVRSEDEPNAENHSAPESSAKDSVATIDISSISSIIVHNNPVNLYHQQLRDAFYDLLCKPVLCPNLLLRALNCQTTKCNKTRKTAFPRNPSELKSECMGAISESLDSSQKEAWYSIISTPLSATIGPPGAGKTHLISAVATAWLQSRSSKEVLLCSAQQNVSVRHLAETLVENGLPGVLLLVSEYYYTEWHESLYVKLAKSVLVKTSAEESPAALREWRKRNQNQEVMIVVCTLAQVGSLAFKSCLMGGEVTSMILDECSQAGEGSCVYPLLSLPHLSSLSVVGDPHQLPPFGQPKFKVASVFDLIAHGCEVKFLRDQYRMPPIICDFVSAEVYDNTLKSAPSRLRKKDVRQPLLWVNIPGVATTDEGKTSIHNVSEAQAIVNVCQQLEMSHRKEVVVLTPYEAQRSRISELLASQGLATEVHNVDSFQGQQSEIVLISLVVAHGFSKFASDKQRANVLLSRVKQFMCIFGNHDVVKKNPKAQIWQNLACFCESNNFVVKEKDIASTIAANLSLAEWTPQAATMVNGK